MSVDPAMTAALLALAHDLANTGDPQDEAALQALLATLHDVGRRDLPLGRLFEGHVDARQIVARYGGDASARLPVDALLGVWNAGLPGEPLVLADGRLSGGKSYASGSGILSHALVTAETPAGPQLVLVDLVAAPPVIDTRWWSVIGMQRSQTHQVRWDGARVDDAWLIGAPGDYTREPWFSGGALRFVAVHAGGVAGLFDLVRAHLVGAARANDPHQAARLAQMFVAADLAAAAVRRAAGAWFTDEPTRTIRVAAARVEVAHLAEQALTLAQQSVGLQGMFTTHPLSTMLTDLMVYLRQPAPDAQRMRVGAAVAEGMLTVTY